MGGIVLCICDLHVLWVWGLIAALLMGLVCVCVDVGIVVCMYILCRYGSLIS